MMSAKKQSRRSVAVNTLYMELMHNDSVKFEDQMKLPDMVYRYRTKKIDKATFFAELRDVFGRCTILEVMNRLSRVTEPGKVHLLNLPQEILDMVVSHNLKGNTSMGMTKFCRAMVTTSLRVTGCDALWQVAVLCRMNRMLADNVVSQYRFMEFLHDTRWRRRGFPTKELYLHMYAIPWEVCNDFEKDMYWESYWDNTPAEVYLKIPDDAPEAVYVMTVQRVYLKLVDNERMSENLPHGYQGPSQLNEGTINYAWLEEINAKAICMKFRTKNQSCRHSDCNHNDFDRKALWVNNPTEMLRYNEIQMNPNYDRYVRKSPGDYALTVPVDSRQRVFFVVSADPLPPPPPPAA